MVRWSPFSFLTLGPTHCFITVEKSKHTFALIFFLNQTVHDLLLYVGLINLNVTFVAFLLSVAPVSWIPIHTYIYIPFSSICIIVLFCLPVHFLSAIIPPPLLFFFQTQTKKNVEEAARSTSNVRSPSHSTASAAYLHIVDTYPYSSMGMFYDYIYFTSYNISSICFDFNYNMLGRALIFLLCVMFMFT